MIHIYGDSFCDPNYATHTDSSTEFWYDKFDEDVLNHGKIGTGPSYSFDLFYKDFIEDVFQKEDKIVFVLSGADRLNFSFLKQVEDSVLCAKLDSTTKKYLKSYEYEIMSFFGTYGKELLFVNLKNIFFLESISKILNVKIIVFMALRDLRGMLDFLKSSKPFTLHHEHLKILGLSENEFNKIVDKIGSINFKQFNSDTFYFHDFPLIDMANDTGKNHLDIDGHRLMFDTISRIINNDYNIDFLWKNTGQHVTDFIYE